MVFFRSLAWDGYHVFVGGENGVLYLWDLKTFKQIDEIQAHAGKYININILSIVLKSSLDLIDFFFLLLL